MKEIKYANAYTEVYEILNCLNEEDYKKIPTDLIEVFEEYRNLDYDYEVNDEQDLSKQPMLKETRAILLNIYRDYLATSDESKMIKAWLQADREYLEKQKIEKYKQNKKLQNDNDSFQIYKADQSNSLPVESKNQVFFRQVIDRIKQYLNIWR